MVVEDSPACVEAVGSKFIWSEYSFSLLCLFLFVALPLDIVGPRNRIAHVLDRLEVVRDHVRLYIGLELPGGRFHLAVFVAVAFGLLFGVVFIDVGVCGM